MMHIACWYSNTIKHMNIQYCKDMRIIAKNYIILELETEHTILKKY